MQWKEKNEQRMEALGHRRHCRRSRHGRLLGPCQVTSSSLSSWWFSNVVLLVILVPTIIHARVADVRSQFIYLFNQEARNIIIEYQQDMPIPQHQAEIMESNSDGTTTNSNTSPRVIKDLQDIHSLISEGAAFSLAETKNNGGGGNYNPYYQDRPFFVQPKYPIARIVEYYSPWCGHCQQFASKYIQTAKDILNRLQGKRDTIEFFAISCSEHHQLCKDEEITGYPTLRAYPAFSKDYIPLTTFTTKIVDETLELGLVRTADIGTSTNSDWDGNGGISNGIQKQSISNTKNDDANWEDNSQDEVQEEEHDGLLHSDSSVDVLGAEKDAYHRTRTTVYRDAALSFTYALEHSIFGDDDDDPRVVLTSEQTKAFMEWIDLLYWTLPPTWILHTMIAEVKLNLVEAMQDSNDNHITSSSSSSDMKEFLLQTVHKLRHVVNDSKSSNWSSTCQRHTSRLSNKRNNNSLGAYSCGLWSLFHIMSIGVMERHKAVLGGRDRVSTHHAAQTLFEYIQHFFTWCEECTDYFTTMYTKCKFNHCKKFRQYHKLKRNKYNHIIPPPPESWKEFPLWVWRIHNDVNEIILKREIKEQQGRNSKPTSLELESVIWPTKEDCPSCYKRKGGGGGSSSTSRNRWDEEQVLKYLKKQYWPGGVQNFRFVVLDKKTTHGMDDDNNGSILFSKWGILSMLLIMIGSDRLWKSWKRRQRYYKIGRHHKRF